MEEVYSEDKTELDGFTEVDDKGVSHQVVWEEVEVMPDTEYEVWFCTSHQRIFYGGCV